MAAEAKSISFSISKKERKKVSDVGKNVLGPEESLDRKLEKDFIHSAEGKELQSVNPKAVKREKVIPCPKKNQWLLASAGGGPDGLDKEAAEELVKELTQKQNGAAESDDNVIPLSMRGSNENSLDTVAKAKESTLEDYEAMPVNDFGAAMLRGMGWKKGEAIGGVNKGLVEPIEFIPRSKGLGLGAEKQLDETSKKRKPKPGDLSSNKKITGPIKEKDGRVRHVKGVGEEAREEMPLDYRIGAFSVIEKGPHKDICGKIVSVDVDNTRITVKLHLSEENVTLHQCHVRLIDKDEYKILCKGKRKAEDEQKPSKRSREEHSASEGSHKSEQNAKESRKENKKSSKKSSSQESQKNVKCWLYPKLRVRIISKDYKKGRFYNRKVEVVDVTSRTSCNCQTEEGKLLEDVSQAMLETVVPKTQGACVRVVHGQHRGQLGIVLERDTSKYRAVVQLSLEKDIAHLDYDDICEHLGDPTEELC